jgi:hypothetical protein
VAAAQLLGHDNAWRKRLEAAWRQGTAALAVPQFPCASMQMLLDIVNMRAQMPLVHMAVLYWLLHVADPSGQRRARQMKRMLFW